MSLTAHLQWPYFVVCVYVLLWEIIMNYTTIKMYRWYTYILLLLHIKVARQGDNK